MTALDAAQAAIMGTNICFDISIGFIEDVEERVKGADVPPQLHVDTGAELAGALFGGEASATYVYDPKSEWQADLARAKKMVRDAELLAMEVLAAVP